MRIMGNMGIMVVMLAAACCLPTTACADLVVTVTPGYQFPLDNSVAPSYQLLNMLAIPTINISGTVGGSNTLAAGSITGTQLSANVVDGVTMIFNGDNPQQLQVNTPGLAGAGLQAVSTTNLALLVDTNYFELNSNSIANGTNSFTGGPLMLTLAPDALTDTNVSPNAAIQPEKMGMWSGSLISGGALVTSTNQSSGINVSNGQPTMLQLAGLRIAYVTNFFTVTNGASILQYSNVTAGLVDSPFVSGLSNVYTTNFAVIVPHGLGVTPQRVRWVLVNQTLEAGYGPGAEVDISGVINNAYETVRTWGADPTNVWFFSQGTSWLLVNYSQTTSGQTTLGTANNELNNWKLKVYAWP